MLGLEEQGSRTRAEWTTQSVCGKTAACTAPRLLSPSEVAVLPPTVLGRALRCQDPHPHPRLHPRPRPRQLRLRLRLPHPLPLRLPHTRKSLTSPVPSWATSPSPPTTCSMAARIPPPQHPLRRPHLPPQHPHLPPHLPPHLRPHLRPHRPPPDQPPHRGSASRSALPTLATASRWISKALLAAGRRHAQQPHPSQLQRP